VRAPWHRRIDGEVPEITYDGYTEVPMKRLMEVSCTLSLQRMAYDHAHLNYISGGKLEIKRTQHDAGTE